MTRAFPFLFREALINLRRHGLMTVAAITTIAVALTLVGSFSLTFSQLRTMSRRTVDAFEMRVFCRPEITRERLDETEAKLRELPGVAEVTYRSRDDAFADAAKSLPIDTVGLPNLMPDTFVVKLRSAERASTTASTIRSWQGDVENVDVPEEELKVVLRLADFIRNLGLLGGALLLFGALVVVVNTIRLSVFSRRREIQIMKIVGATPGFIRLPMLIEGLIHGVVGGLLAALALIALLRYTDTLTVAIPLLASYLEPVNLPLLAISLVSGGGFLGATGAWLSLSRYLR
ncbi:MAG: permease-like cell division protein FtsX [Armatimonadetes bacterium]|nr:permease-like cell division protein FtsX [Armatimonadota bacterium]